MSTVRSQETMLHFGLRARDCKRRVAIKRQLRKLGHTIPAEINSDTHALRAMRREVQS